MSASTCEQASLPAWIEFNSDKLCLRAPSARPEDHAAATKLMAELAKEYGPVNKDGEFDEEGDCSGARCGLYSGYERKYAMAQKRRDAFRKLTKTDMLALVNYTEWGYQGYNSALWAGRGDETDAGQIRLASDALLKLPARPGTTYRVEIDARREEERNDIERRIRRLLPDGATLDKPRAGQRYFFKGFMSTALTKFASHENHAISLEIAGKSGRYIAPLSTREDEEEVLFPAGTWFEVTSIKKVPRKKTEDYPLDFQWRVKLREL